MAPSKAPQKISNGSQPSGKERAQVTAAVCQQASSSQDVECLECAKKAEVQAVILYPALGTPLVAPASEQKIRLFLLTEASCDDKFGIAGHDAPFAWWFINTHLRIQPFKEASKTAASLQCAKLYSGDSAAKAGIKVWYKGVAGAEGKGAGSLGWKDRLIDHQGRVLANLRQSSLEFFTSKLPKAAYSSSPQDIDTTNHPLVHLFEVELDFAGLTVKPEPDAMYNLAWLVTCVYKDKEGLKEPIPFWEHQDKLVYDFFHQMQEEKRHFAKPFAFDLEGLQPNTWPTQQEDERHRIKPYHPFLFKSGKDQLDIGHLTDIHVSSRQFALAQADAAVLEGISSPLGGKVVNCLASAKSLFDQFQSGADKVDALFITGDLLDFNRNLNPEKVPGPSPKEQWEHYNLVGNIGNGELYPRGLDDMLFYSLVKRAYDNGLPVFMTSGNHEAYDEPYGISPRLNSYAAKRAAEPVARAKTVEGPLAAAKRHQPKKSLEDYDPNDVTKTELSGAPDITPRKANEGIPADHNLTIYEACLIYGPTFPQILQSWNYMPDNYDWFFTLFTPLADFAVPYNGQLFTGLQWGDQERMLEGSFIPGGLLPRAIDAISPLQLQLLESAVARGARQHLVFSHFTVVNYGQTKSYSDKESWDVDKLSDDRTSGTFEQQRLPLLQWLEEKKISAHFSGHSHRSGGYKVQLKKGTLYGHNIHVEAHDPAKQPLDTSANAWVTSCGGGIGIQNLCGELHGWNLMPPSGSRYGADGRLKVVTAPGIKPRFCVALDYIQSHLEKTVIRWTLDEFGRLTMEVGQVMQAEPFVEGVTFYAWDKAGKEMVSYVLTVKPERKVFSGHCYTCTGSNLTDLISALQETDAAFVKVDFNRKLASINNSDARAKLYDQFDFDDPWIFRVSAWSPPISRSQESEGTSLVISYDKAGVDHPDWGWLGECFSYRYPKYKKLFRD